MSFTVSLNKKDNVKMGFLEDLRSRDMLAQITHEEELTAHLAEKPRVAYTGFDPTADSLHIGHLLPVMALRRWQMAGHKVIVLVGGGTAMVGDPTGKSEMRSMMTVDMIDQRVELFKKQFSGLLDLENPHRGIVLNNGDWLRKMNYLEFLRDFGRHFSVNRMLTAESVKARLEKGLSFLEFNYMLLQSYDFYHLYKHYGCTVQLGGDDQWSNMLGGMDLVRRIENGSAYCVTVPLLVSTTGAKMGKTENGAIWIDPNKTSPYELFQYFRNIEDGMVQKCLFYFTDLPEQDVRDLGALKDASINEAKIVLAYEATKLLHGEEEAKKAKDAATALFGGGGSEGHDAPEYFVDKNSFGTEMNIADLLALSAIAPSKTEARRWIQQGGLSLDGKKVEDIKYVVTLADIQGEDGILVKKGKKHYYRLKISS
jgi:tyrosyl-tRNA synthetase